MSDLYRILICDGGHDGLLPGRYIARADPRWLPDIYEYGKTAKEAVEKAKQSMREKYPNCLWFTQVPVVDINDAYKDYLKERS